MAKKCTAILLTLLMCLQVVSPAFAHEAGSERTTSLVEKYENVVSGA